MDKNFTPPTARKMFAPEPLSVRLRHWRPTVMQVALTISLALHGLVLGIRFVDPQDFNRVFQDTPLEVILVNARTLDAPTKAQAIAQANLSGGGEADAGIATSPLAPSPSMSIGNDENESHKVIDEMVAMEQQLMTKLEHEVAAMPAPDPRKQSLTPQERQMEEQRQQKLRLLAQIEKRVKEENARPRRHFVSPATREEAYAVYYDALRHRVEARGTADFPSINGHKLYGDLMMNLTIDASGNVVDAEIVQSSNSRWLDQRALAIVRAAAPFGQFSDDMRKQADQIVVTSRFRFTKSDGLETTLSTNGG